MSYQGKYAGRRCAGRGGHSGRRTVTLLLALALLTCGIVGTVALLLDQTQPVSNTFSEVDVPNDIVENFDGTVKESITVQNEGNIAAYIRVRLVTYRVDDNGNRIGGAAEIPTFTPANGWFQVGDYYYYPDPIVPDGSTPNLLPSGGIELKAYTDADGGKQVIEVISESIQSVPESTVNQTWTKVQVVNGKLTRKGA